MILAGFPIFWGAGDGNQADETEGEKNATTHRIVD